MTYSKKISTTNANPRTKREFSEVVFFITALSAITALAAIMVFIFKEGLPIFARTGLRGFLFGVSWSPSHGEFGILPMIIGSAAVTLGAALIGVPAGICCAVFLTEYAPRPLVRVFRPAIQLLAGIPSVVYGFWGLMFVVPLISRHLGGIGLSVLAGSVILGIMMLPTVISISEVSLVALPPDYKRGALALGMTKWQSIFFVQLRAAKSGIAAAVILGIGRAIGETMAVIMVLGNATAIPRSVLDPVRTLTTNIGIEFGYAAGEHMSALFAAGIVLFVIIMLLNIAAQVIMNNE